jgi:hypothetical protein
LRVEWGGWFVAFEFGLRFRPHLVLGVRD